MTTSPRRPIPDEPSDVARVPRYLKELEEIFGDAGDFGEASAIFVGWYLAALQEHLQPHDLQRKAFDDGELSDVGERFRALAGSRPPQGAVPPPLEHDLADVRGRFLAHSVAVAYGGGIGPGGKLIPARARELHALVQELGEVFRRNGRERPEEIAVSVAALPRRERLWILDLLALLPSADIVTETAATAVEATQPAPTASSSRRQQQAPETPRPTSLGRPSKDRDAEHRELAKQVARLHLHEHWNHRRIAEHFGWLRPDENWNDARVRHRIEMRVRRWLRKGEALLAEEYS
jgi:hypothetical protein